MKFEVPNLKFDVWRLKALPLASALACAAGGLSVPGPARGASAGGVSSRPAPPAAGEARGGEARAAALSPEEEALNRRPLRLPLAEPKVAVEKKARRLTLYSGGERVRVFPVALGFAPAGDKQRRGDGRTPEGTFHVCVKNGRSKYFLSLGLTYPNAEDAARGLRGRLITPTQAARIRRAVGAKKAPPWNTALGGEIFIHGGGAASDWTFGCVALADEQMKELFDAVPLGTTVVIEP